MAFHTKYPLCRPRISQIFNLLLAVATTETAGAKCMISGEDSQVLNLVSTSTAAVCAVVADEGAIAKEQKICVGVEECAASVASKAVDVPSVARWRVIRLLSNTGEGTLHLPSSNAFPSSSICQQVASH